MATHHFLTTPSNKIPLCGIWKAEGLMHFWHPHACLMKPLQKQSSVKQKWQWCDRSAREEGQMEGQWNPILFVLTHWIQIGSLQQQRTTGSMITEDDWWVLDVSTKKKVRQGSHMTPEDSNFCLTTTACMQIPQRTNPKIAAVPIHCPTVGKPLQEMIKDILRWQIRTTKNDHGSIWTKQQRTSPPKSQQECAKVDPAQAFLLQCALWTGELINQRPNEHSRRSKQRMPHWNYDVNMQVWIRGWKRSFHNVKGTGTQSG